MITCPGWPGYWDVCPSVAPYVPISDQLPRGSIVALVLVLLFLAALAFGAFVWAQLT